MTNPHSIDRATAPSYTWGDGCTGWHLVRTVDLSVIQEEMPPGTAEVRHQHQNSRQFFFVLRGTLVIECGGTRHELHSHNGLEIAPLTPHQVRNESADPVEVLVISQPPSHGDRELVE